jgi:hypothetical protein
MNPEDFLDEIEAVTFDRLAEDGREAEGDSDDEA